MNKISVGILRSLVVATGLRETEDQILKGIGFYNDGRKEAIERKMLEAHKSNDWQAKGHALSRELGECFKMAYQSPRKGKVGAWSWEFESFLTLENKLLTLSHIDHGMISIKRNELSGSLTFGGIQGQWDDLPSWKIRILAKSLMAKFQYKIEKQLKYSLRECPSPQRS